MTRLHFKRARLEELEHAACALAPKLYRLAFARLGQVQDAEDVVQDAYLKAFRSIDSYQPGTNMEAWLVQILINTIRDHYRHSLRSTPSEPLDEIIEQVGGPATSGPEQKLMEKEVDERVLTVLKNTPEWLLTPFLLREIHEMSYRQLADVLSVPIGTIMSRLSRARQYLRGQLKISQGDPEKTGGTSKDKFKYLMCEDEQV